MARLRKTIIMIYTVTYWCWNKYINVPVQNATMSISPTKDDWLVVFQPYSTDRRQLVSSIINRFDYSKRVLIHYEGRYRQPHGFRLRYQQQFGRIYTYNSTDIDNDTVKYMPIPLWITEQECYPTGNRTNFFSTVITNHFRDGEPRGVIINKLKALGMEVYGGAGKPVPLEIKNDTSDTYERNLPRYSAKIKLLSDYTFAFAIESQLDLGHLTEKPFDAIAAGCILVYLGPKDTSTFIPKNCYIDYRDFWSESDLMNYLKNMSQAKIQEYQRAIAKHQRVLVGMRTFESCMRFLCKDLGFDCDAPYYDDVIALSRTLASRSE